MSDREVVQRSCGHVRLDVSTELRDRFFKGPHRFSRAVQREEAAASKAQHACAQRSLGSQILRESLCDLRTAGGELLLGLKDSELIVSRRRSLAEDIAHSDSEP